MEQQKLGYIYKIVNDINDKVYVGETTRNLEVRFSEHCYDKRSNSQIHKAIKELGVQHFKIVEIERVPLDQLYEREAYWVEYYNSYYKGYNGTIDGHGVNDFKNRRFYQSVHVIEPNLYFDSAESLGRDISRLTAWSARFCTEKIRIALNQNKPFLTYHLEYVTINEDSLSSIDDCENWIKNLNIEFAGKHIYCPELDKEFNTTGEAAKFLLDNHYYIGKSFKPLQNLVTLIGNVIDTPNTLTVLKEALHFEHCPGTTKNSGAKTPFIKNPIICIELNKQFNSQQEAAQYMLENQYWTGIKLKTAKLRISDVVCGNFPNYKGYSFKYADK